jgi:hypothetical protein
MADEIGKSAHVSDIGLGRRHAKIDISPFAAKVKTATLIRDEPGKILH